MILVLLLSGCAPPILNGTTAAEKGARAAWQPGDPIPGWEDEECKIPEGGNVLRFGGWSPPAYFHGGFEYDPDLATDGFFWWLGWWEDCDGFDCGGVPGDGEFPALYFLLSSGPFEAETRGQGAYPSESTTSWVDQSKLLFDSLFGTVQQGLADCGWECNTSLDSADVCLQSVRPDGIRGRVLMTGLPGSPMETVSYERAVFVVEFDVRFEDHSGYENGVTAVAPPSGGEQKSRIFYNYISYDEAWPWDEITDDAIRQQVYDRYTPWNLQ